MRVLLLAAIVGLAGAGPVQAQSASAMVVIVKGTKEFHQPGCPVVAKAGSNVTVTRRGEATRRGLKAHDCDVPEAGAAKPDPNQEKVVSQPGDNKYHRTTCKKLGDKRTMLSLDEAGRKLWPCPVCKPPIRQRKPPADQ